MTWVITSLSTLASQFPLSPATAHIHLMQPRIPLRELDAQTESAIRALEDGADTVTVVNEFHRVDRIAMPAPASETESSHGRAA